jgi:AcrR family transcriptional regulator
MRVKTDERRSKIIQAATEVFSKVGYHRASMAMIADRVGGSKTTLYGYFPSKEELFWGAMTGAMPEQGEKTLQLLDPLDSDVASVLQRFGEAYIGLFASRTAIEVTRTAIAESGADPKLGALLYQRGPKRVFDALTNYLSQLVKQGTICQIEPHMGAVQLKSLFDAGVVEPLLFGAKPEIGRKDAVAAAVATFLRAYGNGDFFVAPSPAAGPTNGSSRSDSKKNVRT